MQKKPNMHVTAEMQTAKTKVHSAPHYSIASKRQSSHITHERRIGSLHSNPSYNIVCRQMCPSSVPWANRHV